MDELYTIGTVADMAGVGIETIRFYERRGLLHAPPRNSSGYRIYSAEVVARIRFIRDARELGFSLTEVVVLLRGHDKSPESCIAVKTLLENKSQEINVQLNRARLAKRNLAQLISDCPATGECEECHVVSFVSN